METKERPENATGLRIEETAGHAKSLERTRKHDGQRMAPFVLAHDEEVHIDRCLACRAGEAERENVYSVDNDPSDVAATASRYRTLDKLGVERGRRAGAILAGVRRFEPADGYDGIPPVDTDDLVTPGTFTGICARAWRAS